MCRRIGSPSAPPDDDDDYIPSVPRRIKIYLFQAFPDKLQLFCDLFPKRSPSHAVPSLPRVVNDLRSFLFFFLRCTFISVNDIRRFRDACVRVRVLCEEASSFVRLTDCSRSSRCSSAMRSFVWMSDCAHVPYHRLMTLRQSTSTYLAYLP